MSEKGALLEALLGDIISDVKTGADERIKELSDKVSGDIEEIKTKVSESLKEITDMMSGKPVVYNFGTVEQPKNEIVHKSFSKVISILQATKRKEKNIMLVGGAGGGKTHLVKQIADSLKLNFYPFSVGLQTTKSDLLGFVSATGQYIPSPIRLAYENGGVLLLDEFDSAHPGVVTILNSLLANGHASFPDKIIDKNEKFICICACNTYGRGANVDYVGRNRLDGATLDRFIVVDVDYDEELEAQLTHNDRWIEVIKGIRKNIESQGIKMIVSPRASMDGADLLDAGFDVDDVLDMVVFKGADKDIRQKALQGVSLDGVKKSKSGKKSKQKAVTVDESSVIGESSAIESFEPDVKIFVDFDNMKYSTSNDYDFRVVKNRDWKSSFDLACDRVFTTFLGKDVLYINPTKGMIKGFDKVDVDSGDVNHFLRSINKHAGSYKGEKKILINTVYHGETQTVLLGA